MTEKYGDLKRKLEDILTELQRSDIALDEVIDLHKKGQQILKKLQKYIDDINTKLVEKQTSK